MTQCSLVRFLLFLVALPPAAWAQSIPNPSFESNNFTVYPGYVNLNGGVISSWTYSALINRIGLNPAGGNPFADNGLRSGNVAFIQSADNVASTLSTTITGLTAGRIYSVTFFRNCRSGYAAPGASWSLNSGSFVSFNAYPAVGGANPYYPVSGSFTATASTAGLSIRNVSAGDSALLVDAFTIANVNGTPTDVALSPTSLAENVAANTSVGTLSSSDPDAANTFTYALVSGTGSTDNAGFTITGSTLKINASPNYEAKSSYAIRVRTTDQGGLFFEKALTIDITNVNETPSALALSANTLAENVAANTNVGTLSTTDPDASNTFTYTLVSGAGSTDNAAFNFSGNALRITVSPDFETQSNYAVRVRTSDQGGLLFEQQFSITITDANDAPTFSGYAVSTPYQTAASASLGKLLTKAADVEGDALSVTAAGPTSAQGGTAVLQASSILYTPATGFSGTDTFPITITDARGASVIGTVTVTVQPNAGIGLNPPVITVLSGGRIGLGFQGIPGRSYQIQRSINLTDWTTLTTVTASLTNGAVNFIDESPPQPNGYYWLRKP